MTVTEKRLQEAIREGNECLAVSILENLQQIESRLTFESAKSIPKVFIKVEDMMNKSLRSYVSANNARGVRSVLITTNSLNTIQKGIIFRANGYLLEKIARQIFCESRISSNVVMEILEDIPMCFIINSICLICEQWHKNGINVEVRAETFKNRVDELCTKRPEILCESLLKYEEFFSESFQANLRNL